MLESGVARAGRRAVLNIGLDIPGGGRIAPEEALAVLERAGIKPVRSMVAQSDTEPTLVLELDRSLNPEQAHQVSTLLQQEAIAQVDEHGAGDLFGPGADKWKPFNGDYFINPSGKRFTDEVMDFGDPNARPGGAEPDPVTEHIDAMLAGLKKEKEPAYAEGGQVVDDEGRQHFDKGNLVRKLGTGLIDMLDFSGVAGKQVRDEVINNKELRGDGRKFKDFFADVTSGKSDKYKPSGLDNYDPAIKLGNDAAAFRMLRDHYSGSFDNHIKTSIPGFDETQNAVGSALLKTYGKNGGDILDIGSSEGALIKALSDASEGRIRTTGIDPNPDMLRTYRDKPQAKGSQSILSAFGSADDAGKVAWEEADGTAIPYFNPQGEQYDAAHEAMVFQFISNARRAQAERTKQLLKPKGLAIFEEKFGGPKEAFDANEALKDKYKGQYYTPEQLEIKRKEVLNTGNDAVEGMTDLQVSQAEMEAILKDTFKNRAQFWDSGNFKGYVGSDDKRALEDFLNNLQPLDSMYATAKTPRGFAGGGAVWDDEVRPFIDDATTPMNYGVPDPNSYVGTSQGDEPTLVDIMRGASNVAASGAPSDSRGERNWNRNREEFIRRMVGAEEDGSPSEWRGPFTYNASDTANYLNTLTDFSPLALGEIAHDIPYEAGVTGDYSTAALEGGLNALMTSPGMRVAGKGAKEVYKAAVKNPKTVAAGLAGLGYAGSGSDAEAGVFGRLGKWGASAEGKTALNDAIKLSAIGADSADIIARTGWFKDVDGHWKYYRTSAGGSLKPNAGSTLGAVLDDPHLYEEYPQLFDMKYRRMNDEGAHYSPANKEVVLGDTSLPGYNKPESGGQYGTVLHEVYHAKADLEGWPQGTSPDGAQAKIAQDMTKFLNSKHATPDFNTGQDLFQRSKPKSGLYHGRYEAETGEALARREAAIREVGPDLMRVTTPADQAYIDKPIGDLFHPGEQPSAEKYRALLKYLDDVAAANDAMAAKGEVYWPKPVKKGKK